MARLSLSLLAILALSRFGAAETVATWLFDEQIGLYPSCVLGDAATGRFPMVLGRGGQIVAGKYGNALEPKSQTSIELTDDSQWTGFEVEPESVHPRGDTTCAAPLAWTSAMFATLMTRGEKHLRSEVGFGAPTDSRLNLGAFDWTVEFWYQPAATKNGTGVVFELGAGPRGVNESVTRLSLNTTTAKFLFENTPSGANLEISSAPIDAAAETKAWRHYAFVYSAKDNQLRHYVDGQLQEAREHLEIAALPVGDEDYFTLGRDGCWENPLPGRIDEFRVSTGQVYRDAFTPPSSFSRASTDTSRKSKVIRRPLLFAKVADSAVVPLKGRKYVFIDDAIIAESTDVEFCVNPPRRAEQVLSDVRGHLTVLQDDEGIVRIYLDGPRRSLAVVTARDGVHFETPDLGREFRNARNVVIEDPVGLGNVFIDKIAPPEERYKYVSGFRGRGIYVYSSPDGFTFQRNETSALPFRGASQSNVFFDDQRGVYVGFHRSDAAKTAGGKTSRSFVMTETCDINRPWPFKPVSQENQAELAKFKRLADKNPYYLDNGPLTPPGFGVEYPTIFAGDDAMDPPATDIYVPKCLKYQWEPDTYLAFPLVYFHYHGDGPRTRQALGARDRERGSGPLETQLATSRDGIHWKRYPHPAYIRIGRHADLHTHRTYIAHGLVRRGDEIWQYYLGEESYHSPWTRGGKNAVFRVVQRVDGFVSVDTPYTGGRILTRPFVFDGSRLELNINTGAVGHAQVGFRDASGTPIEGYSVDDCVYINGDHIDKEVEWLEAGKDVSELAGKPVRLEFQMRGTKLFSMQFVN